ncbi:uncharacterized protein LOC105197970 [Solenopsis invicta]|uniref:uncharacterized protein LOC105197970 n=1 Tax=Solenopsis invicta TaxID=13686 RepID=UPI000595F02F|nr:uncharacterized protein LOC105197970 [Solenopsis invicta]
MYFNVAGKIQCFLKAESVNTDGTYDGARKTRDNERSQFLYARDISQVHLPKIAIPKFSGKYEDWYPFHNTFESIIYSNTKLTDIQRFHYLISSLESDAAHVIKSLKTTSDNYHQALDLLKQRYNDKRVIAQEHIKALYELPTVPKGNRNVLRKLIDDVLRHLRSLKNLSRPTERWDDLIVYLIISKLDATLTSDWKDHIPPSDIPTLKQLTDFLTHKCKTLSTVSKKVPSDSTNLNMRKATGKATSVHLTTTNICCFYYKEKHYIFQCPSFLKLLSKDRNKKARAKRLCINCLRSTTHQAKECRSSTCQTCSKRHNTLLHMQDKEVKAQKGSESTDQTNEAVNAGAVTLNHHTIQGGYKEVILSTAIVMVNDRHGNSHTCRVLLDLGAMFNIITDKIPNNIKLADPQFHIAADIDILIGNEYFWKLICVDQIHEHKNQQTHYKKLNWVGLAVTKYITMAPQNHLESAPYQSISKLIKQ